MSKSLFAKIRDFLASITWPPPYKPPPAKTEKELADFYRAKALEAERAVKAFRKPLFKPANPGAGAAECKAGPAPPTVAERNARPDETPKTFADMKPPGYWSASSGRFITVRLVTDEEFWEDNDTLKDWYWPK